MHSGVSEYTNCAKRESQQCHSRERLHCILIILDDEDGEV